MTQYHGLIFSVNDLQGGRGPGAHKIANTLRAEGWDVEVIDFTIHWSLEELKDLVRSRIHTRTKFFGFSCMFAKPWPPMLNDFTEWLKRSFPYACTIIGGQSVINTPAENIDYWVDSFAENSIIALLDSLTGNTPMPVKFYEVAGKRLIRSSLDYPTLPPKSYFNTYEARDFVEPYEWATTEFSRGCKFKCKFCMHPMIGLKQDISRDVDSFIHEMQYNYDTFGIADYYTADETFNDSPEKIKKFAEAVDKLSFKPYYSGFVRPDLLAIRKDTWDDLIKLGFGGHYYGIETFNHEAGKIIGKGYDPEKLKEGILEWKNYVKGKMPFRATMSFILGLPKESKQDLYNSLSWLKENWTEHNFVCFPLDLGDKRQYMQEAQTVQSDLMRNKELYGLREMKTDKIPVSNSLWKEHCITDQKFVWEHDLMNMFDAYAMDDHWWENRWDFRTSNWHLHMISFVKQQHFLDIPNVEEISVLWEDPVVVEKWNKFFDNYKYKKLSWIPPQRQALKKRT